jgi:hypothetical protein
MLKSTVGAMIRVPAIANPVEKANDLHALNFGASQAFRSMLEFQAFVRPAMSVQVLTSNYI